MLLEFNSISNFTDYLKFMYRESVRFARAEYNEELNEYSNDRTTYSAPTMVSANSDTNFNSSNFSTAEHDVSNQNTIHYTQECSVYIYAICFSTIMKCSYWTDQTQIAIVEQAVQSNDDFFYESQTSFPIFL